MLEGLDDLLIEKSLNLEFKAINNQTEYESIIIEMSFSLEVYTSILKSKSEYYLVAKLVVGKYHMKEPQLI